MRCLLVWVVCLWLLFRFCVDLVWCIVICLLLSCFTLYVCGELIVCFEFVGFVEGFIVVRVSVYVLGGLLMLVLGLVYTGLLVLFYSLGVVCCLFCCLLFGVLLLVVV